VDSETRPKPGSVQIVKNENANVSHWINGLHKASPRDKDRQMADHKVASMAVAILLQQGLETEGKAVLAGPIPAGQPGHPGSNRVERDREEIRAVQGVVMTG
jgi:hypothetical protein